MSDSLLRIGITMRVIKVKGYHESRDALAQDWAAFMKAALPSAAWMPLPNLGAENVCRSCEQWGINRLILSGGEDLGVSLIRDETERTLLSWAKKLRIPVLGICRGMQLMATDAGSSLLPVMGHVQTRHILTGALSHEVNSFHNYRISECPRGFRVSAQSEDGCIEAIRSEDFKWEWWMWHPEREKLFSEADIKHLRDLFA